MDEHMIKVGKSWWSITQLWFKGWPYDQLGFFLVMVEEESVVLELGGWMDALSHALCALTV